MKTKEIKKIERRKEQAGQEPNRRDVEPFIFTEDKKMIEELARQNKYVRGLLTS